MNIFEAIESDISLAQDVGLRLVDCCQPVPGSLAHRIARNVVTLLRTYPISLCVPTGDRDDLAARSAPVETDSPYPQALRDKYGVHVLSCAPVEIDHTEPAARRNRYRSLSDVLERAFDQASSGKGAARHGQALPFEAQPMQTISDLLNGNEGLLYQAIKKVQESTRLDRDKAVFELLGAINYLAGAVIHLEKDNGH